MIKLSNVVVRYPGSTPLDGIDAVIADSPSAVVGPSGSGKSTLLRVLAGTQAPDEGEAEIDGIPVRRPSWRRAGDPRVALIHQDYRLVPFLSVSENVALAAELKGGPTSHSDVVDALAKVGLDAGFLTRSPTTLSGGEQQRVAIARALATGVRVLVADEPTGALDARNSELVANSLLRVARDSDVLVIVATHDPVVAGLMTSVYELTQGSLVRMS